MVYQVSAEGIDLKTIAAVSAKLQRFAGRDTSAVNRAALVIAGCYTGTSEALLQ